MESTESRGALLTVAIPLIVFKVWFAILLLIYAPTRDTMVWIAATHWSMLFVLALLIPTAIAVYRLIKVRMRREKLKRAEFMVAATPAAQCPALWEMVSRLEGGD
jgi:hypothetical protein